MKDLSLYESIPTFNDKASIKTHVHQSGRGMYSHWHEHMEWLYFFDGCGTITCGGNTFPVQKGDMIVVNSTQIHSIHSDSPLHYGCVLLYPSFFWDIAFDSSILIENHIAGDEFVKNQLEGIFQEYAKKEPGFDIMIKGACASLLGYLLRNYADEQKRTQTSTQPLRKEHLLFDYIANHYQEKLTTASLAKFCHVDESYFCRFFKKNFGKTPHSYLTEYRVEKATKLLRNTQKTISEIASETGFEDNNYFSRAFKKIKGITPSQFRQKYSGKSEK